MNKNIKKNIYFSSIILTAFIIFIKLLGLIKHVVIAQNIGANFETDAFYIATGVIGHLSILVFSSLSITLLSMYSEKKENENINKANNLISASLNFFIPIAFLITIIFYFFSPAIAKVLAPSYEGEQLTILIRYIKIMSFSFIPCCYYLIGNAILEEEKIFVPGRFKDLFQHLFVIISALFLYEKYGIDSLVYSFLFASIVQAIIIYFKIKKYYKYKFSLELLKNNKSSLKLLLLLSLPLLIGNAVYEINDIVDKQISTSLSFGYATLLTYGATLNEIVTGVVINSISVVLFSNFATYVAKKDFANVEKKLIEVMNVLVALLIPIMIIFIICGYDLTNIFYGSGRLTNNDLYNIYFVLIGYSIGFVFQAFRSIFSKVLYAFKKTKVTMVNGIITITINIVLSLIFSSMFGLWGVALATSVSLLFGIILLFFDIKKVLPNITIRKLTFEYWKLFISGIVTACVSFIFHYYMIYSSIINVIIISFLTFIIYGSLLYLLKWRELEKLKYIFIKK